VKGHQDMDIFSALAGGDRRSIGCVAAVVPFVLDHPEQLPLLIDGMESQDEALRMRCADAAEKISIRRPDWFVPLRSRLLQLARTSVQQELRWHIAQMLPRIDRPNQVWCADITYLHAWETGSQAKAGVGRWITFYNHQRPHAAHGGQPPAVVYFNSIETDQQVQAVA